MNYIYKYTNKVNNKNYIGKTNRPNRRKYEHLYSSANNSQYVFHKAIRKYGIHSFDYEILEEIAGAEWEDRETFYIKKFNSLVPNGYNVATGGQSGPSLTGFENFNSILNKKQLDLIIDRLKNTEDSYTDIARDFKISRHTIIRLNIGTTYINPEIEYPIRKRYLTNDEVDVIIELLETTEKRHSEIAELFNTTRSAVTHINNGVHHKRDNLEYPIRSGYISKKTDFIVKEMIKDGYLQKDIAEFVGLNKATVRKIKNNFYYNS